MSAPFSESLLRLGSVWGTPVLVLAMAFLGSGHCAAMCGGLAAAASSEKVRGAHIIYQTSRLAGYLCLGFGAGYIGDAFLGDTARSGLPLLAGAGVAIALVLSGWKLWKQASPSHGGRVGRWSAGLWRALLPASRDRPLLRAASIGFLTFLLPCGFLYSYVLLATASRHWASGGVVLFSFWLGTVPALSLGPWLIQFLGRRIPQARQRWVALLLLGLGLLNLTEKLGPVLRHVGSGADEALSSIPACVHGPSR